MIRYYDYLNQKYVYVDKPKIIKLLKSFHITDEVSKYTIGNGDTYITMFNPVYHFYGINKESLELAAPQIIVAHNANEMFYFISDKKEPVIDIFEYIGKLTTNIKPNFLNIESTHF